MAAMWDLMADDYGLLPTLAVDAVLARADRGELDEAVPRLLDLTVGHQLTISQACDVAVRLGDHPWTANQQVAIEEVFDAWWQETLMLEPGEHEAPFTPDVVLGVLAGYDAPMIRWFEPWLAELDGPGAFHLVSLIVGGEIPDGPPAPVIGFAPQPPPPSPVTPTGPAWEGKVDQAGQVIGWAKSETVINGLALIGGTHLESWVLGDALDRLI